MAVVGWPPRNCFLLTRSQQKHTLGCLAPSATGIAEVRRVRTRRRYEIAPDDPANRGMGGDVGTAGGVPLVVSLRL